MSRLFKKLFVKNFTATKNSDEDDANAAPHTSRSSAHSNSNNDEAESLVKNVNNRKEFEEILKSNKGKFILVEFYALWCGPCKILAKKFQDVAEKYQDIVIVLQVNVDQLEELAIEYNVTNMPSFMVVRDGEKLEQYFGSKLEQFDEMVEKYLATAT